ncbi:hypothetical protein NDU88_006536 [Pleurodeles waltl]|uniref:Uncharacterized protein n=1 Tax=Pleurodeles waltl TaxID=8319 RepID=A0AAV7QNV6_PLEWA|nr:hypothetical protein NDU88_006536 [Pleurodeles waltl]
MRSASAVRALEDADDPETPLPFIMSMSFYCGRRLSPLETEVFPGRQRLLELRRRSHFACARRRVRRVGP